MKIKRERIKIVYPSLNCSLRLMTVLPLLYWSSYSEGAIQESGVTSIISPFEVTKHNDHNSIEVVDSHKEQNSVTSNFATDLNATNNSFTNNQTALKVALVGVLVNGQDQGNIDALYDTGEVITTIDKNNKSSLTKNNYYLAIDDIERLTAVYFIKNKNQSTEARDQTASYVESSYVYQVKTPIGETKLSGDEIMTFQNHTDQNQARYFNSATKEYISLSTLKKLGVSAQYYPKDLAIRLNMGWRPQVIQANNDIDTDTHNKDQAPPIDYYPDKAGLLGVSFNSAISVSERKQINQGHVNNQKVNNIQADERIFNRQTVADIGAFGYIAGGIWGVKGIGRDAESSDTTKPSDDHFSDQGLEAITTLPWDWQNWHIDNLYWTKSGKRYATRIGTNHPNALGQGATLSGADFTGAMFAYSNRDVARHLTVFDDNSKSLLENTSQDYQHLTGIAEPGGVAELRINSRPIARVQIGLDGRYEFLNLDVNGIDLTDTFVEIAIYEYPAARQPLEVRPMFLGKRRTNVATGEVLIEAGLGRSGNLLEDNTLNTNRHTAAHIYSEYGVNNRVAVRGGVNTIPSLNKNTDIAWHAGINIAPTTYSNADLSYAHSPVQDMWQVDFNHHRHKLWLDYQYQARQYESKQYISPALDLPHKERFDQRHQLLLSYRPSEYTTINVNQYYNDLEGQSLSHNEKDDYYVYSSVYRRFNESLTGGINWSSRGNLYGYRFLWQDIPNLLLYETNQNRPYQRNSLGLSGNNDSETLSLRHVLNSRTILAQSISHLHNAPSLLYQGDMSHKFDYNRTTLSNQLTVGYSLYDSHFGWQADWQLAHKNGVNFSLGYQHRYVNNIPDYNNYAINTLIDNTSNNVVKAWQDKPWGNENYLYARLSFNLFKSPRQPLRLGRITPQRQGDIIVDIAHPPKLAVDTQSMRFLLNGKKVDASLISAQNTRSQYLMSNIREGDYTLKMDAKNLPIEFSTSELLTPSIRVDNYAPTFVPIELETTYGFSGKLFDQRAGVVVNIYESDQQNVLSDTPLKSTITGNYGYFQVFGLKPGTYILKADGYLPKFVEIKDDFVMQLELKPKVWSRTP